MRSEEMIWRWKKCWWLKVFACLPLVLFDFLLASSALKGNLDLWDLLRLRISRSALIPRLFNRFVLALSLFASWAGPGAAEERSTKKEMANKVQNTLTTASLQYCTGFILKMNLNNLLQQSNVCVKRVYTFF